jgi:IS30 family transposase
MPYTHFSDYERNALQGMLGMGLAKDRIARLLGKHISTIYREINRNIHGTMYIGLDASYYARKRRRDTKPKPKRDNKPLMDYVESLIEKDWSPERIAGRIKKDNPDNSAKWISHETIYQYIYERMREKPELKRRMRHPRLHRGHRKNRKVRKTHIRNDVLLELHQRFAPLNELEEALME